MKLTHVIGVRLSQHIPAMKLDWCFALSPRRRIDAWVDVTIEHVDLVESTMSLVCHRNLI